MFVCWLVACLLRRLVVVVGVVAVVVVGVVPVSKPYSTVVPSILKKPKKKHKSKGVMRYHSTRSDLFGAPVANL